ncbi:sulfatase [Ideonella sp.]|uniref:sulfatase n=1 Tax=Ideonella sp. TaxID=1929293 RepID=UPI003BB4E07F
MIALDDLNDWVGYMAGHPQVKTPALDALARRSHAFLNAFCTAPVCSASRAGVLSGRSVQSTGVKDLYSTFKSVNPNLRTFDEMLAGAGFTVKRFGKIDHVYSPFTQPLPATMPYTNKQCAARTDEGAFDWGPAPGDDSEMPDYRYAQQGIDFLKSQDPSKPFCLNVGFIRNHVGWYVPQRFIDMYPLDSIVVPSVPQDELSDIGPQGQAIALKFNFHNCIVGQSLWASAVRGYLASITWVDSQIARLIAALDASPHAKNTMVVLWSDHGFHLGEKFHWHKEALWDKSTRVPCLIRTSSQTTGVRQSAPISLRDLAPTMLDYCGVNSDYAMDGISLRPLLQNPSTNWDRPVLTTLDGIHHAVRTQQWRYIRYSTGETELYDEINDPSEFVNLAALPTYAPIIASLDALMPPRVS